MLLPGLGHEPPASFHRLALEAAWNSFFHATDSPVSLAVFRIFFGLLLCIESVGLLRHGREVFGLQGLAPDSLTAVSNTFSIERNLFRVTRDHADDWIPFMFVVYAVACVFLALGLFTKIAGFLIFLNFASRSKQNWYVIQGADNVAKFMSLLLVFSNAGAVLSLDALFRLPMMGATAAASSQWPQKLMQIQLGIIYLRTALWKLRDRSWIDGTAVFHALYRNPHARWDPMPPWLLSAPMIALMTWGTLVTEFAGGTLIWFRETRYVVIASLVFFHLSLEALLRLKYFQWMMVVCLLLFIPMGPG